MMFQPICVELIALAILLPFLMVSQALLCATRTLPESRDEPLRSNDDDLCRLKREAKERGEGIVP